MELGLTTFAETITASGSGDVAAHGERLRQVVDVAACDSADRRAVQL